jgi:hypothetical protein
VIGHRRQELTIRLKARGHETGRGLVVDALLRRVGSAGQQRWEPCRLSTTTPVAPTAPAGAPAPAPPSPADVALKPATTQHSAVASALLEELSARPDLAALEPAQRNYALHEAAASHDYCTVNATLRAMLDCGCHARAFLAARLESGFALAAGASAADREAALRLMVDRMGLTRAEAEERLRRTDAQNPPQLAVESTAILQSFVNRERPIGDCLSADAVRSVVGSWASGPSRSGRGAPSPAVLSCLQEATWERIRQNPVLSLLTTEVMATGEGLAVVVLGGSKRRLGTKAARDRLTRIVLRDRQVLQGGST